MPYADKQKQREAEYRWQSKPENKERRRTLKRERVAQRVEEVQRYKAITPCADCGNTYHPECMDFDHLDGHEKMDAVSKLIRGGYSKEVVQAEMDKCELVCSNCHRLRSCRRRINMVAEAI